MTLGGNLSTSSTFCCLVVIVLASNLTLTGIPAIAHQAEQSERGIWSRFNFEELVLGSFRNL